MHELGGQIALLGVSHSESTTLHVAESLAGVPYAVVYPCVVEVDGVACWASIPETDHCCAGFQRLDAWLTARGLQRDGKVGHGRGKLSEAKDVVATALEHLAADRLVFLCGVGQGCEACDLARASVP